MEFGTGSRISVMFYLVDTLTDYLPRLIEAPKLIAELEFSMVSSARGW